MEPRTLVTKAGWLLIVVLTLIMTSLTVTRVTAVGPCSPTSTAMDSEEAQFLVLLNNYRAENGLVALVLSPGLTRSATWMAEDLASHTYWSHTSSDGRLYWERIRDCGYSAAWIGENLAAGMPTAQHALDAWKSSPGHDQNMLDPAWRAIGIARAQGGPYGWYWATDFGTTVDTTAPTPVKLMHRYVIMGIGKDGSW